MCWNENVSLNTFIFTTAVLIFIYYNNTYTQYKIKEFDDKFIYIFVVAFTSMQLIEYFLWKSINGKNKSMNYLFSIIGWITIRIIQPIVMLSLLPVKYALYKTISFIVYFVTLLGYVIYKYLYNPINFVTNVGKSGHLEWKWTNVNHRSFDLIINLFYFLCYIPAFLKFPILTSAVFMILLITYLKYKLEAGSLWCFFSNSILIYILFKILFILPLKEYSKLC